MPGNDTLQLIGRTIADKYAVEAVVGEGGFATVYRAMHTIWKRPVALKVFKALGEFSEKDRQRLLDEFVQEGALLADLSARTAAIVQARDIGMLQTPKGEHIPYMVLEWLEGATLEAVMEDERARSLPLRSVADAVRLLDPAAEALALAHRKGIAHRDIKPGNVFVIGDPRGENTVKLLDFGIAKVVNDAQKMAGSFNKTSGQVTSFTPAYGAPEQFSRTHGSTGPWTDVFSLALIVAELVSGKEPLEGDDFLQLAVAAANTDRRPTPRTLGAPVSDEVEAIFLQAVAIKPTARWQSAGEFWNALRQALRMDPLRGMTDPMPGRSIPSVPNPVESAPTIAVASVAQPAVGAVATVPRTATTTTGRSPGSGKMGLFVALGVAAVAAIGGAVFFLGRGSGPTAGTSATNPAVPPSAASASSATSAAAPSASAVAAGCPAGMVQIPGGSFFMGSDDGLPLEKPAHQVVIHPFCMDQFEVTVDAYKNCSDSGRCKRAGTTNEWDGIADKERKAFDPLCNVRDPSGKARHPINCVDWDMADKFCHEDGKRLPTEAEWEFSARGPDGRKYPWGDDDPASAHMNACGKECVAWGVKNGIEEKAMYDADDGFANTAPVGSFPKGASRYGIQDVVGNVWEWVADYYGPYASGEQKDPKGPPDGTERVIRGGAWNGSYPSWVRPTFRYKDSPTKRSYGIGFRCAK
ncbi:MAG: bifunctional serine/threonine-protein kinase/formylglycine-generating enzyme family protein [Polyangiaceae bacterium]